MNAWTIFSTIKHRAIVQNCVWHDGESLIFLQHYRKEMETNRNKRREESQRSWYPSQPLSDSGWPRPADLTVARSPTRVGWYCENILLLTLSSGTCTWQNHWGSWRELDRTRQDISVFSLKRRGIQWRQTKPQGHRISNSEILPLLIITYNNPLLDLGVIKTNSL